MAKSLCKVVPQGRVKGGGGISRQILDKFKNRVNIDIFLWNLNMLFVLTISNPSIKKIEFRAS